MSNLNIEDRINIKLIFLKVYLCSNYHHKINIIIIIRKNKKEGSKKNYQLSMCNVQLKKSGNVIWAKAQFVRGFKTP